MNDLHFIFYEPKRMFLDTSDMSCEAANAHRRLCDFIWFNDGPPQNQNKTLKQITLTDESNWSAVKRELLRKGWLEINEFFLHRGAIKSLNESKVKYVENFNRQAKMNKAVPLKLSAPDAVTGIVTIIVTLPVTPNVTPMQSESQPESELNKTSPHPKSPSSKGVRGEGKCRVPSAECRVGDGDGGGHRPAATSELETATGALEVPTEAEAVGMTMNAGVAEDFARYVFADWSCRGGRDSGGVLVPWLAYVVKRWARESGQWRNGTHRGKENRSANNGKINPRNVGMSETAADKVADIRAVIAAQKAKA